MMSSGRAITIWARSHRRESEALEALRSGNRRQLARVITAVENRTYPMRIRQSLLQAAAGIKTPVLGITGTGGAGKSSLTDELILRLAARSGGSGAGGRALDRPVAQAHGGCTARRSHPHERHRFGADFHALARYARHRHGVVRCACPRCSLPANSAASISIVVETSGIGQGGSGIVPLADTSLYVMTPEFGAASQLEKIDMLDFADFVAINKFDRKGAEDALRDVRKQYQRNRGHFQQAPDTMPVYGTMASRFNDDGVTALYQAMAARLEEQGLKLKAGKLPRLAVKASSRGRAIVPPERVRYLAEIAETVRGYHRLVDAQARTARERQSLKTAKTLVRESGQGGGRFR